RDMVYYQSLLPWLKLILNQYSPFAVKGEQAGISFLFPMEKVFESYVAKQLQLALPNGYSLRTQLSHVHLAHQSTTQQKAFLLKPDLAIYYGQECVAILDTKWKLVDANLTYDNGNPDPKAGISQADMYQLYAYGHKYLNGVGRLFLIYPQWAQFNANKPVPSFEFNDDLTLDVLPFDLESGRLEINLAVNGFGQLAD
ncbi:MAG: restriction endonuclease, partial [Thiotrichales bacterium]|nr:restriction endonuclease [Thiotrichales bacterium]